MATLKDPIRFPDIKNGWYVSYFFMTQASYTYTVKLENKSRTKVYAFWSKSSDDSNPQRDAGTFLFDGNDGDLICTVDCPQSHKLSQGEFSETGIFAPGYKKMGDIYTSTFDDGGGVVDYNDLYINVVGWMYYG